MAKTTLSGVLSALLAAALAVPTGAASLLGYVVRRDAQTVYLDLGEASGARKGGEFAVFTEGDELKHPVSGQSLGRIETVVARGKIEEVKPGYSVGRLLPGAAQVAPGQKVRLEAAAAPATTAAQTAAAPPSDSRQPLSRGPWLPIEAVSMAFADVTGDGAKDIILAGSKSITVYAPESQTPLCSMDDSATGLRFLSVDALDLDGNGRAEIFASLHNSFFERFETQVLECEGGALRKIATLPFLTRAYADPAGTWRLASQQLLLDETFPFGGIYELEYQNGRYSQGHRLNLARLGWLYSFAQGAENLHFFYTPNNKIRAQEPKGNSLSKDAYGQSANRLTWRERQVVFGPRLVPARGPESFEGLYAVKNIPGLGGLAGAFGIFSGSEVHFLKWNGLALEPQWTAEIGGYAPDLWLDGDRVLVAVVSKNEKTSVWTFPR